MKKQLLSTSAIALGVAAAAPASAQDWNLDWGGYMSQHLAWVDASDNTTTNDYDGIGFLNESEIIFSPSVTLDNGLTFGVNVQFEAANGTDNNDGGGDASNSGIDESYIQISGDSFGQILIGAENSAGYKMMIGAPGVTSMYINSPSVSAFIPLSNAAPFSFRQAGVSSYTEVAGNNDVNRITYFTPNFNGFQLGVSYARNDNGAGAPASFSAGATNNNTNAGIEDIFDIGVSYSQSFGTTDVSLAARWGTASAVDPADSDPDTWGIGAQVSFSGVTIGGSYAENDNGDGSFGDDNQGWSFGGTYDAAGPWAFEALTYQGEWDGEDTGSASDYQAYRIGASRDLGPGVDWDLYVVYAETDNDNGDNVDGTIVGTAINLSF